MKRDDIHRNGYLSGRVVRWHTWPTLHKPNVAEHQCRVAQIYCELWGLPRAEVLYYCINHDRGEQFAGDVPFGGKDRAPGFRVALAEAEGMGLGWQGVELPDLDPQEYKRFKICDMLEMTEFCICEMRMGNTFADVPLGDLQRKIMVLAGELCETLRVHNWIGSL